MADQLPSWTDGQARAALLEFVRAVTEPGVSFVPPPERVAAFDNDGTLWCEKLMYPQADFLLRRWEEMARAHPGLAKKQPWKAVTEGNQKWLAGVLEHVPGESGANTGELAEQIRAARPLGPGASELVRGGGDG